ncbi:SseB family protein [uncultured Methanobrevibacter sp.]|uniref:SseB family protein n=1 Tax=uncultured Methanobrevibacter sp. TaxID=253161 RepID=UPI0025E54412|nr:SseB family protein [uncultured Methanobrevibacter sp.]
MEQAKLDEDTAVDNSRLEELIRQEITPQMQMEFFEVLKESRLFLPVDFGEDAFKGIENSKPGDEIEGPSGFGIQFLTDDKGNKAVPLFTSEKKMAEAGVHTSVMVMYMRDLAGMLAQSDRYSIIAINPFTEFDLNMPIEAFLAQFDIRPDGLRELLAKEDLDGDELIEELMSSQMIAGCVDTDEGTNFVLIWDNDKKPHLPLFTDIEEFKKMFENYTGDVYPQAYYFSDLIDVANNNIVINPACESVVLDLETIKGQ